MISALILGLVWLQQQGETFVQGTIVSIRAGLLIVKPSLRPKLIRVAVGPTTELVGFQSSSISLATPGMFLAYEGQMENGVLENGFLTYGSTRAGPLKNGPPRTIKSVQPLVIVDADGKETSFQISSGVRVFEAFPIQRNDLLIGTRILVRGTIAPDEVVQAESVWPDREYAASGTMFATIESRKGNRLLIVPRFTHDHLTVILDPKAAIEREHRLDPDTIHVGRRVSFWGRYQDPDAPGEKQQGLLAIALTLGPLHYPRSPGVAGGEIVTGTLRSLEPDVTLKLDNGKVITIIIPAQLIVSRLEMANLAELRPGASGMFVLSSRYGGAFTVKRCVLDASPWVGYGN